MTIAARDHRDLHPRGADRYETPTFHGYPEAGDEVRVVYRSKRTGDLTERAGVEGDPVPDIAYGDDLDAAAGARLDDALNPDGGEPNDDLTVPKTVRDVAARTAAEGLLTEQQAVAYVLRDVEGKDRHTTAAMMDLAPSTVDHHRSEADGKLDAARNTLERLERLED